MKFLHKFLLPLIISIVPVAVFGVAEFHGTGFNIAGATGCSQVVVGGATSGGTITRVTYSGMFHPQVGDLVLGIFRPGAAQTPPNLITMASPPINRDCEFFNTTLLFFDSAINSLDEVTQGCTAGQHVASQSLRTSAFGGGTNNGSLTLLSQTVGTLTPAQINGTWNVCVFDSVSTIRGSVNATELQFSSDFVTAADVTITGRVLMSDGRGATNAEVRITDDAGVSRTVTTGRNGRFAFDNLASGKTYVLSALSRRFSYEPKVISVNDDLTDVDFHPATSRVR
jgi:hypothetical protein